MATKIAQIPTPAAPTVANIDVASLQVSLPQMLDLALGTPEVGAVNFNILHNFLHVLLHQINLQGTKVEYRGENADRVKTMVTSLKPRPTLHLHEYNITDVTGKVSKRTRETDGIEVDVLAEDIGLPAETSVKVTKGVTQQIGPEAEREVQTVIFVEPITNDTTPTSLAFKQLEQSVKQLQQQFQALEELSETPEVIQRIKEGVTDPFADMWQIINIKKRLDINEKDINKLTTIVQEVISSDVGVTTTVETPLHKTRLDNLENQISKMEQKLTNLQSAVNTLLGGALQDVDDYVDTSEPAKAPVTDETVIPFHVKEETTSEVPKMPGPSANRRIPANNNSMLEIQSDVDNLKKEVTQIQEEVRDLRDKFGQSEIPKQITVTDIAPVQERPVAIKETKEKVHEEIDAMNLQQCLEAVKKVETTQSKVLHDVTDRVGKLEKEVDYLLEKIDSIAAASAEGGNGINELVAKMQEIQTDMEKFGQIADKLLEDKESREAHLKALLEQIELLKVIKADKEDLEDALADKADAQVVNRKVSHDQFDAACDDLARGLEEAIDKLAKQETIWQQALDEVQNEIASKVDKMEMTPLKDFVNSKLKSLQEKLKSIAEMTREVEAAGTKKMLRDVQCISCDKDVVMKVEEVSKFRVDPLPCTTSIKPYLTYELDQVRKQQKKLPHSRNMIQYEAAIQEEAKKIKTTKEEALTKTPRDHLCNRYCGGSHTITTPQQRVMRTGHFLTQWGPEMIQLTDGLIRGKDGQTYRGRPMPSKLEVCGPACWESQISMETRPSRSQEHVLPVLTTPRKCMQSRRSSAGSQKRFSRKLSKEPIIIEASIAEVNNNTTIQIEEEKQLTTPEKTNDRLLITPTEAQDEIILYETDETGQTEE